MTYRAIPDVNAILSALQTGDIDIARVIAAKDVATVKSDSKFIYRDTPAIGFNGFELNTGSAPFNDPAKRKALADLYRGTAAEYFRNYKKLVYLSQAPPAGAIEEARRIADSFGFAFEHRFTGYGELGTRLAALAAGQDVVAWQA